MFANNVGSTGRRDLLNYDTSIPEGNLHYLQTKKIN